MNTQIQKRNFPVLNMSCAACAARVNKVLNELTGVQEAKVNYANASAFISYDTNRISTEQIRQAVIDAGYDLVIGENEAANYNEAATLQIHKYRKLKRQTIYASILSAVIMTVGMVFPHHFSSHLLQAILAAPVVFWFGRDFFKRAWHQLHLHTSNMDTLVALSTGTAYLFSLSNLLFPNFWLTHHIQPHVYFDSAAMIITFILLGRSLEEKAKGSTSQAIRNLMGLQPNKVTCINDDGTQQVIDISKVNVGMCILVKPGERIAVDGVVSNGESYVDESMLTGEPMPKHKHPGDTVYAGTINQQGSFRFEARQIGKTTMLARIIRTVEEAQGSKPPVQLLVDKVAAIFVPLILGISIITLLIWFFIDPHEGVSRGILSAITVLVIACPCALGLATPTAIMVGIGNGARRGILIKNADSLEMARHIDIVVVDKTGTLTQGVPTLAYQYWTNDHKQMAQQIAYSLEQHSEHPLARAILNGLDVEPIPMTDIKSHTGMGISGRYETDNYWVGNLLMLQHFGGIADQELLQKANQWQQKASTVVWVGKNDTILGLLAISDQIKPDSIKAVSLLGKRGIKVIMLTGDNQYTAQAVANEVGITDYQANMLPIEKANFIRSLKQQGHHVAMVGDGINDSAALASADLSIAMGHGSDIAIDVAQMTIMESDLLKIVDAIKLSELTVRTIRQNLFWAFAYNLIGIPIAAGILYPVWHFMLDPMWAGALMAFSSVSVVLNSLRLKKVNITSESNQPQESTKTEIIDNGVTRVYHIDGMSCKHCQARVEKALQSIEGVTVKVDLEKAQAEIHFTHSPLSIDKLQQIITDQAGDYTISI